MSLEDHSRVLLIWFYIRLYYLLPWYTFMYNASIHFELATFVARNKIYRYYTQQLVVVEWHCYCC